MTDLQEMVNNIITESGRMGMSVKTDTTVVQHIGLEKKEVEIMIDQHKLKKFEDLGGSISGDTSTDQDVKCKN